MVVLAGLFVWAGTVEPKPADNSYPGSEEIAENPTAHLGEYVLVGGTVTGYDPLTIEAEYGVDGTLTLEIGNVENPPPVGHTLQVFGPLTDPGTVHAENTVTRAPWEATYMYVVSFLGGLWVLARLLGQWRPDRDSLSVVPRGDRNG